MKRDGYEGRRKEVEEREGVWVRWKVIALDRERRMELREGEKGWKKGGRDGGREGGRNGGREGGRNRGREGGRREKGNNSLPTFSKCW